MANQDRLSGSLLPTPTLVGKLSSTGNQITGKLSNSFVTGKSAYEIAVENGFAGTEEEWLESLKGDSIELRNNDGVIEYKYIDDSEDEWKPLIDLSTNTINQILVNGEALPIENQAVDIPVPENLSQLTNDANYCKIVHVTELPTENIDPNTIYMLEGEE